MKKILLFLFFSITSFAQTLDTTFDTDGIVKSELSNGLPSKNQPYDAILQPDGKIIYVGEVTTPQTGYGFVARYNTDGTKDATFNQYGFKTISASYGFFQAVSLQSDGKILVAGAYQLYRLLPNGDLDTSFNVTGKSSLILGGQVMNIKSIAIQADSKIVVSGYMSNGTNNDFAVARLNANGTLDTTFDADGYILTPIGTANDQGFSLKIQTDGKIVVVGEFFNGTTYDFALIRLNTNGTLDATFGTGGKTTTAIGGNDYGRSLEILPDGTVLVLGSSSNRFSVAKYTSSGILDTSFNTTGKLLLTQAIVVSSSVSTVIAHLMPRIKALSDGSILLSGTSAADFAIIKLRANGTNDLTFDADGLVTINNDDESSSVLLTKADGSIVTGGVSYVTATTNYKIRQVELSAAGVVLSNTIKDLYLGYNNEKEMIVLLDGKFLVLADSPFVSLIKYNQDGTVDTTFGTSGIVNLASEASWITNLIIQNDNKILIGFNTSLVRLNVNGSYDTSFNGSGVLDINTMTGGDFEHSDALFVMPNNQIMVSCEFRPFDASNNIFAVLKLNENGTIDTGFATAGVFLQRLNPNVGTSNECAHRIFLQPDNKLMFVGYSRFNSTRIGDLFSLRMSLRGVLDNSYGVSGVAYLSFPENTYPTSSHLLSDNKLLISAVKNYSTTKTIKLDENGQYDNSFGTNGIADDIAGTYYTAMTIQTNGKILKAGKKNNHFSISRYNTNGSVDTTFGLNGELNTVIDYSSYINDIVLQPDGKIVVAGNSFNGVSDIITLARFTNNDLGVLDFNIVKNSLLIYPNPIESVATFEFTLNESAQISIELYDMQGKLVQTIAKNKEFSTGRQKLPIQLNQFLTTGNYILKIASPKGSQSIQILKK